MALGLTDAKVVRLRRNQEIGLSCPGVDKNYFFEIFIEGSTQFLIF